MAARSTVLAFVVALALMAGATEPPVAAANGGSPAMAQGSNAAGASSTAAEVGYVPPQMGVAAQLYGANKNRVVEHDGRAGSDTGSNDSTSQGSASDSPDDNTSGASSLASAGGARVVVYAAVAGCLASMLAGF
ncbi:hypothetical protein H4R19_006475 [Coemansia spiralis]|nr:hypothetical protein H4R19_006475 [Coemansia spiralis]